MHGSQAGWGCSGATRPPQTPSPVQTISLGCCDMKKRNEFEKYCSLLRMMSADTSVRYERYSEEIRKVPLLAGENRKHGHVKSP